MVVYTQSSNDLPFWAATSCKPEPAKSQSIFSIVQAPSPTFIGIDCFHHSFAPSVCTNHILRLLFLRVDLRLCSPYLLCCASDKSFVKVKCIFRKIITCANNLFVLIYLSSLPQGGLVVEDMYIPKRTAQWVYKGYKIIKTTVEGEELAEM